MRRSCLHTRWWTLVHAWCSLYCCPHLTSFIITGRNEVVAKVIFLHLSVILFTGGSASVHAGISPRDQADTPPPGTRQTPLPPGPGRHPSPRDQADTPRDQSDTPLQVQADPPWDQADTPPDQADPPPQTRQTPPPDQTPPPREADSSIRSKSGR